MLQKVFQTTVFLLLIVLLASSVLSFEIQAVFGEIQKPIVKVIVDSAVYGALEYSLERYGLDVENSGFSVNITQTNQLPDSTSMGIRACLQQAYGQGLVGALLVGDVSEAWFEVEDHKFPTDLYYMDLDGVWFDLDNNGIYDARGGDLTPEIWVGRLKASTAGEDQAALLNNYFNKNHAYRNGLFNIPWWRSLLYIDDPGTFNAKEAEASLSYVSPDRTVVADPSITNTTDYKNRLSDSQGYQWLYLMSHGGVGGHNLYVPIKGIPELEGTIYSSDYSEINPRILFYQFFTCSASRYTDQDYLAGAVVFKTQWGLGAIGSSDDIFTVSFDDFYRSLSEGKTLGASFKEWLGNAIKTHSMDYVSEKRYRILFNAINLVGDATLCPVIENHDVAITNLEAYSENSTGVESFFITVTVENHGEFAEYVKVEILYDFKSMCIFNMVLGIGERSSVTFSPLDSFQFIWGKHSIHHIEAKASTTSGEFHKSDNSQVVFFEGRIIEDPWMPQLSPVIYAVAANAVFALVGWGVIKLLMSDRPWVLVYLMKLFRFLARKSDD